jgi:hypothetical protein
MRYRGGIADPVLNLHHPGRTAGNVEQIAKAATMTCAYLSENAQSADG